MTTPQSHNTKFYKNPPVEGSRVGNAGMTDGQTDMTKIICAFCDLGERASKLFFLCTVCVSESGDFATLLFLVRQHWGGCRYRHFAASFKAF